MPPPPLYRPEWFLRRIVSQRLMRDLGYRVEKFYDDLFEEMVYRAHHNSIKIADSYIFFKDFEDYVARACGLKRGFWKHLSSGSVLRYMRERLTRLLRLMKRRGFYGDIRWSIEPWLAQLSFWYETTKSFYGVWKRVAIEGQTIPTAVRWDEGIVLYIIYDFVKCFQSAGEECVKKRFVSKYRRYVELERAERARVLEETLRRMKVLKDRNQNSVE